jgi:long-chain acyl-CoA synthetase
VTAIGLWAIAGSEPQRTAAVDPDGRIVTYAELAAEADRIGRGLREAGLRTGDCVAVQLPNSAAVLAAFFAAMETGLYIVPINWHLVGAEVAYILKDCEAKVFIAHERFGATAAEAADTAGVAANARFAIGAIAGFRSFDGLGADTEGRPDERTMGAPMVYTSGTSGRPKGVRRPLTGADPDQLPPNATWFFGIFDMRPFDGHVHLCGSPLYHTAVLNFATISVQLGHPVVLMDRWDPEEMLRLIEKHRVTHSHMVPTQFMRLLALPDTARSAYDLSSMRCMIHSAAPCPPEIKRRMIEWWGPVIVEYYAASEGGGTTIFAEEWLRKPGSVGRPWPGSLVHVLDDAGNDVAAGSIGQVFLQMGSATFEYHRDAAKTQASRVGSLFTVGDIGYLDDEGYLFLCDRRSDVIISGGVNIYPAEIEGELLCHPDVADVAVFGIPHAEWGEQIKAVVQPERGVEPGPALTESIVEFLGGRVAKFKLPSSVDYVDELPRDPNGKLYKRRLRDAYWKDRDRQI